MSAALLAAPIAMSSRVDFSPRLEVVSRSIDFGDRFLSEFRSQTLERSVEFGGGVAQVFAEPRDFVDYLSRWMVSLTASYPFIALWTLLAGGPIDRYARMRSTGAHGAAAASGAFFLPFLRLGIVMAFVYAAAFRVAGQWPVVLAGVLAVCNAVFDYTQVRMVVEDRRSVLVAIKAALTFIRRNLAAVFVLHLLNWLVFAAVTAVYVLLGPGTGFRFGPDAPIAWTILLWIVINQIYVLARLWTRLLFWSTSVSLFQSRLAHAGYVARPVPTWPDSPSAEAIRRLS